MALSVALRPVLAVLAITSLLLPLTEAISVVRRIEELKQSSYKPGVTHITVGGAIAHGHTEIEAWLNTLAPGVGTVLHRHAIEEIYIVAKGGGTLYLAPGPESENKFPGEPEAFPFSANSSFSIPVNAVHQVINTKDEDLQVYIILSQPPMTGCYLYKDWNTPHDDATLLIPPWDVQEKMTSTKDEL